MELITLPSWTDQLRPAQTESIQKIIDAFDTSDVVFFEAPTGTGKTLIGEIVRQQLHARTCYLCSSISLQEQFHRDFPNAAILKGRSNYPTLDNPGRFTPSRPFASLSCADCNKTRTDYGFQCQWCSDTKACPYERAKATALRSDLVCANSYYFLYEANFVGTLSHRDLVIIDECDTLESVLMSFIQVDISASRMKEFNLPYPTRKTVESTWPAWAEEALIAAKLAKESFQLSLFPALPEIKRAKRLDNLVSDLERLCNERTGLQVGGWVYDGYKTNSVTFKPITIAPYAEQYLWRHGKKWLMMSATILSLEEMAMSLGLK